ncbi:glutaredoxin-like protein [Chrysochromulina tobinii]|uniref:Glutaredoxin-like protein n=1 Tax=Chrysochromulina tobinii TaxID=1460289 RepID=A0A0M0K5F6_9EUKA|nr:glutaredoxin-like protein [Chrysochromulina tobinii]|eukprot:KOO34091.1 glutaredoxin-like protein [Chrysochromulina sp. CCMP291]
MKAVASMLVLALSSAAALQLPQTPASSVRRRSPPPSLNEAMTKDRIEKMIADNKVLLFMKGDKIQPQCGFSNTAVMILKAVTESAGCDFQTFNVLADNDVREGIKKHSNWPTIPQCYIDGEFVGGCDLLIEMYQNGELAEMVEKAAAS